MAVELILPSTACGAPARRSLVAITAAAVKSSAASARTASPAAPRRAGATPATIPAAMMCDDAILLYSIG